MVEIHKLKCVHMKYTVYEYEDDDTINVQWKQCKFMFLVFHLWNKKIGSLGYNAWVSLKWNASFKI